MPRCPSHVGLVFLRNRTIMCQVSCTTLCSPSQRARPRFSVSRPAFGPATIFYFSCPNRCALRALFLLLLLNLSLLGQKTPSVGFNSLTCTLPSFIAQNIVPLGERSTRLRRMCVLRDVVGGQLRLAGGAFKTRLPHGFRSVCPTVTDTAVFNSLQPRG